MGRMWVCGIAASIAVAHSAMAIAQASPRQVPPVTQQQPAGIPDDSIVVTGRKAPDAATVRALTQSVTPEIAFNQPMARFADPICLATAGLPSAALGAIADRLFEDAQQAGLTLAGEHCRPNVVLLFVADGQVEIDVLAKKRPQFFGDLDLHDFRKVLAEPGPVHLVTRTAIRSRDGEPLYEGTLEVSTASQAALPFRRDVVASVMLIDRDKVQGLSFVQIADYAAMRMLALARAKVRAGSATILTLFDAGQAAPPAELTDFDRGYLRGLYSGAANERGILKVERIARDIIKATPQTR